MANHDAASSDFMYDVFLSFKEGNSNAFTDHLYQALLDNGIRAVRHDEIRLALLETIEKSRMSMVVLCGNYAYSTRCLDELLKIIECYDAKGKQVLAIFYKVESSDVWDQKNSYEAAMIQHENMHGKDSAKVKAWRLALSRIHDLSGEHCRDNKYESGLIKKIVKDTFAKLPPVPLEIKYLVGLEYRFEQVKSCLDTESSDTVCLLGIYGESGIGKTTFATYLYNKIRHQFEAARFIQNVREKLNSSNGLEDLQKTLLYGIGEVTQTMVGKPRHKRVLLVLDDVDMLKQLESLVGGCDWFGSGSSIIITTRDATVLDAAVLDKHDVKIKKYKMEELNSRDSLKLFCWYAFNMSEPAENFEDISKHVVSYAKGVPSALKVLGSYLKGLSVEEWEMELEKYRKVPNAFSFLLDTF